MEEKKVTEPALTWSTQAGKLRGSETDRFEHRLSVVESNLERALHEVRVIRAAIGIQNVVRERGYASNRYALFTKGGSVKGIKDKIVEILRARNEPMSSEQLAEALYVDDPKVSFDLFKRRVIVAVSAMHTAKPSILLAVDGPKGGRGKYWIPNAKGAAEATPEVGTGTIGDGKRALPSSLPDPSSGS